MKWLLLLAIAVIVAVSIAQVNDAANTPQTICTTVVQTDPNTLVATATDRCTTGP